MKSSSTGRHLSMVVGIIVLIQWVYLGVDRGRDAKTHQRRKQQNMSSFLPGCGWVTLVSEQIKMFRLGLVNASD